MYIVYLLIIGIFALLIGSFLNVCIYRIPLKEDIAIKPSHCTTCQHRLGVMDLIPLLSYLFLGARCRYCRAKISIRYPIIELTNSLAYMSIYIIFQQIYPGQHYKMLISMILFSILLVISVIDIDHMIIPDSLNFLIFIIGIFNLIYMITINESIIDNIIGFFSVSLVLLLIGLVSGGNMGAGDVKLMAVSGFLLGNKLIILALFLASIMASLFAIPLLITKKIKRKSTIAFGPFLSAGIIISYIFGHDIIKFYLNSLFK